MSKQPDYYAVLGVPPTADAKTIKNAYRALAKRLHPDLGGDAAKLAAVNEAADVLTDPTRRAAYDLDRKGQAGGARAGAGGTSGAPTRGSATAPSSSIEPDKPPPPKATVALCELCGTVNRVKGDPRYYPAQCGKCGKPLGTRAPEPSGRGEDPFAGFQAASAQAPVQARCPHCQARNMVTAGPGKEIQCLSCGRAYMPGTGETNDSLGQAFSDLATSLFGAGADNTTRGMKFAEGKLRDMADELQRRREELEKRKQP